MDHSLQHAHDVFIVSPRAFNIERNEFVEVAVCVVLFSSESRSNFEHPLEATGHAQLLEQLW